MPRGQSARKTITIVNSGCHAPCFVTEDMYIMNIHMYIMKIHKCVHQNLWTDLGADHDVSTIDSWAEVQSTAGLTGNPGILHIHVVFTCMLNLDAVAHACCKIPCIYSSRMLNLHALAHMCNINLHALAHMCDTFYCQILRNANKVARKMTAILLICAVINSTDEPAGNPQNSLVVRNY